VLFKEVDGLRLAVFGDDEILAGEAGDGIAAVFSDDYVEEDLMSGGAEDRDLGNVG